MQQLIDAGLDIAKRAEALNDDYRAWVEECKAQVPEDSTADVQGFVDWKTGPRLDEGVQVGQVVNKVWTSMDADMIRKAIDCLIAVDEQGI